MRCIALFAMSIFCTFACAQRRTAQIIDAAGVESIVISSDEIFKVEISAAPGDKIYVNTRSEGEYYDEISLGSEIKENTLLLQSQFRKILQSGFDKLSAHKVFAMEVELHIPENLPVEIISNVASVYGSGKFKDLLIQLKSGSCYLNDFLGNALINTYEGNVLIETSNAQVKASSRHGTIDVDESDHGENKITVTSINGNISVRKTK